jgi:hypothetical protein
MFSKNNFFSKIQTVAGCRISICSAELKKQTPQQPTNNHNKLKNQL